MFTGIVEGTGTVQWLKRSTGGTELRITVPSSLQPIATGESLAVNGCCLTLTSAKGDAHSFDLLEETLRKTNLGALRPGDRVNLERPLAANGRLGGHFVQGHIDTVTSVIGMTPSGADHRLEITLPSEFAHYAAYKGSIAINGVSLTVAEILPASVVVWIIPHTVEVTNLGALTAGSPVNLEFDILAKYLDRMREVGPRS